MNLIHLPNEILVNLFDRLDADTVFQMSKVDRRFNEIIKSHKLYKPVVDSICIVEYFDYDHLWITFTLTLNGVIRKIPIQLRKDDTWENQKRILVKFVQKLPASGTRSVDLVLGPTELDMISIFQEAGLNLRFLVSCLTSSAITLNFVNDLFLDELKPTKQMEPFFFENCLTSICFRTILNYAESLKEENVSKKWNFGIIRMTEADEQFLADFLKADVNVYYKLWKNPRTRKITNKLGRRENSRTSQGGFYWQNEEILDANCFNR